jgi:hypothetical protein
MSDMPIMGSKYLKSMPMAMLDERQAMKNHGQSLKRLAERGGLAPSEALSIMDGLHWGAVKVCDENDLRLSRRVERFMERKS